MVSLMALNTRNETVEKVRLYLFVQKLTKGAFFMAQDTSNLQNPFIVGERIYLRPLEPAQMGNTLFLVLLSTRTIA